MFFERLNVEDVCFANSASQPHSLTLKYLIRVLMPITFLSQNKLWDTQFFSAKYDLEPFQSTYGPANVASLFRTYLLKI